ncbi:MAG: hypothetical protein AAFW46_15330 [Pseudomonadota bacterium]
MSGDEAARTRPAPALTTAHWRALDAMAAALESPGTISAAVGPDGAAAGALADQLAAAAPRGLQIVRIDGAGLSSAGLLEALVEAVGAREAAAGAANLADALAQRLEQLTSRDAGVAVVLDQADGAQPEALALLGSLAAEAPERSTGARLRVALFGRPTLLDRLVDTGLVVLRHAAEHACELRFATSDETRAFFRKAVHATGREIEDAALALAHERTAGAPELIAPLLEALANGAARDQEGAVSAERLDALWRALALDAARERLSAAAGGVDLARFARPEADAPALGEFAPRAVAIDRPKRGAARTQGRGVEPGALTDDSQQDMDDASGRSSNRPSARHGRAAERLSALLDGERRADLRSGVGARLRRLARDPSGQALRATAALVLLGLAAPLVWTTAERISAETASGPLGMRLSLDDAPAASPRIAAANSDASQIDTADPGLISSLAASVFAEEPVERRPALSDEVRRRRVDALLALASRRMAAEQYTLPAGDSAYAALLSAHRLDPESPDLADAFDALVAVYVERAEQALADRRFDRFHKLHALGERIRARRPL